MSLKSSIFICLIDCIFAKLPLTTNPIVIGQLVPKIQVVEGLQKQKETKKLSDLFGFILKSVFVSADSFCLNTSHIGLLGRGKGK